jgi:hypothetical protein
LTCVYGPQDKPDKVAFLAELRDIRAALPGLWALYGDFNMIYCDEDKQWKPKPTDDGAISTLPE